MRRCSASRTGPRLTPNDAASSTSLSWEPGGRTPSMTLVRIRSPTIDAKVARGIRVGVLLFATVCSWKPFAATPRVVSRGAVAPLSNS